MPSLPYCILYLSAICTAAALENVSTSILYGLTPDLIILLALATITDVFPEPATDMIHTCPSIVLMASCCSLLYFNQILLNSELFIS